MKLRLPLLIVTAALLLVTGCQPELRVKLASAAERIPQPAFSVEETGRPGQRPRYNTIKVSDADGNVTWHLRANPFGDENSVAQFRYGETPAGFETVVSPAPLEASRTYSVSVIGIAAGSLRLEVDADGNVRTQR